MLEDRLMEPTETRAGLDADLLQERLSPLSVGGQRVRLPPGAVEREHQLRTRMLPKRLRTDERLQPTDHRVLAPEGQLGVDLRLGRDPAQLVEPPAFARHERLLLEIRQRGPTPE